MPHVIVDPADIQDRDGGGMVRGTLFGHFPFLTRLFADGGDQGPVIARAAAWAMPGLSIEIAKRSDNATGFEAYRNDGSSNAALHGSVGDGGWRKISRTSTGQRPGRQVKEQR
jgi:hypothetical protein